MTAAGTSALAETSALEEWISRENKLGNATLAAEVKSGNTGLAQVNGMRGETDTVEKMKMRIEYDLNYLRNWSLALDLKIILQTVAVVLKRQNAY